MYAMYAMLCTTATFSESSNLKFFPEKVYIASWLIANSCIHVSVSDLYNPRIRLPIWLQQNRQTDPGNINSILLTDIECSNWETEHYNSVLEITKPCKSFFSGNHESEPDIYIRFSPAFHLECGHSEFRLIINDASLHDF